MIVNSLHFTRCGLCRCFVKWWTLICAVFILVHRIAFQWENRSICNDPRPFWSFIALLREFQWESQQKIDRSRSLSWPGFSIYFFAVINWSKFVGIRKSSIAVFDFIYISSDNNSYNFTNKFGTRYDHGCRLYRPCTTSSCITLLKLWLHCAIFCLWRKL